MYRDEACETVTLYCKQCNYNHQLWPVLLRVLANNAHISTSIIPLDLIKAHMQVLATLTLP